MKKIKELLLKFKKNSPAYMRWLLLGLAICLLIIFILVIIPTKSAPESAGNVPENVQIKAAPANLNINGKVGVETIKTVNVSSNGATIYDVKLSSKDIDGEKTTNTCTSIKNISKGISCSVDFVWKPTKNVSNGAAKISIKYGEIGGATEAYRTLNIPVVLNATGEVKKVDVPKIEAKSEEPKKADAPKADDKKIEPAKVEEKVEESVKVEEPAVEEESAELEVVEESADEPAADDTAEEVAADTEEVVAADTEEVVADDASEEPAAEEETISEVADDAAEEPAEEVSAEDEETAKLEAWLAENPASEVPDVVEESKADSCYKFSFTGYNLSGVASGWIRPDKGRYMYHPFTDKDCKKPTGEYNMDTGFITDIKNKSKKIGSDAEHIQEANASRLNITVPSLSNAPAERVVNKARQLSLEEISSSGTGMKVIFESTAEADELQPSSKDDAIISSERPYNRKYVLRMYKPIPATIVNDVRADDSVNFLPVRAVVERNVYSDAERTIIIPVGTMLIGYVTGELPGPYKTIGRMQICWQQMIRPDGVEFQLGTDCDVFAGDSQGRVGVPGRGATDYLEQMIVPMAAGLVPAAVNMIAPVADRFVNQIDLNNNTIVQSGDIRSSEKAKQEIIKSWDVVTQRLAMDMFENMTPPFTIPSGTRITVMSRRDIIVNWAGSGLAPSPYTSRMREGGFGTSTPGADDASMVGQTRSIINSGGYDEKTGKIDWSKSQTPGNAFMNQFLKQANQYDSKYKVQKGMYNEQQKGIAPVKDEKGNNAELGLQYDDAGMIVDPSSYGQTEAPMTAEEEIFSESGDGGAIGVCPDGVTSPDVDGCCCADPSAADCEVLSTYEKINIINQCCQVNGEMAPDGFPANCWEPLLM